MLREWVGDGYFTRDHTNFAYPVEFPLSEAEPETSEVDIGLAQVASSVQSTIQQSVETLAGDVADTENQAEPSQPEDMQQTSAALQSEKMPARGEFDALKLFGQGLLVLLQKLKRCFRCAVYPG
jgi:hypothetical protein